MAKDQRPETRHAADDEIGVGKLMFRSVQTDKIPIDAGEQKIRLREKTGQSDQIIAKFAENRWMMVRMNLKTRIENVADQTDVQ